MVGVWLVLACVGGLVVAGCAHPRAPVQDLRSPTVADPWTQVGSWRVSAKDGTRAELAPVETAWGAGIEIAYALAGDYGWAQMRHDAPAGAPEDAAFTFLVKGEATGDLEIKFIDRDGSIFGTKFSLERAFSDWSRITAYRADLEYWYGGNPDWNGLAAVDIAFSGQGSGRMSLADIGLVGREIPSSFSASAQADALPGFFRAPYDGPLIDPDADLPGYGFRQRRAAELVPEDPRVLEWLKTLQDVSSPGRQVLPTTEDNQLQTFNNSLVAMAFLVKGERERAERILDFFARATDRDNEDPTLQNFFYNGEARGFFQWVALNDEPGLEALHARDADRWMGDMAWLLFAYKYYELLHGPERYREVTGLLLDLLVSWYRDDPNVPGGGYVQHGWRKSDAYLHEPDGHPEGNIDCYAVFKLYGRDDLAAKVRTWVEVVAQGNRQPLDLYTWRVLAYDGERAELLDIPDRDLRYRKTLTVNGREVTGPYHSANRSVTNIWLDGLGQLACAYLAAGNRERGWFYANQFDPLLMDSALGGKATRTLPYTVNEQGGFDFDQSKGYISVAAYYIFAKSSFNPMRPSVKPARERKGADRG